MTQRARGTNSKSPLVFAGFFAILVMVAMTSGCSRRGEAGTAVDKLSACDTVRHYNRLDPPSLDDQQEVVAHARNFSRILGGYRDELRYKDQDGKQKLPSPEVTADVAAMRRAMEKFRDAVEQAQGAEGMREAESVLAGNEGFMAADRRLQEFAARTCG
jgi:hypothetical protein